MIVTDLIIFLEHGDCVGRNSWPDNMGVFLDKDRGVCRLKKKEGVKTTITDYLWPIEDLKAVDWTIIFFEGGE